MEIRFRARDHRSDIGNDPAWEKAVDFFVLRRNSLDVGGICLTPAFMQTVLALPTPEQREARLAARFVGTGQRFDAADFRQLLLDLDDAAPTITGQIVSSQRGGPSLGTLVLDPARGGARAYETSGDVFLRTRNDEHELEIEHRRLAAQILAHPAYAALDTEARTRVRSIIDFARTHTSRHGETHYYLHRLLALLNTPDAPPAATAAMQAQVGAAGAERVQQFVQSQADIAGEERASRDPARRWARVQAQARSASGAAPYFRVDSSDVRNIVVHVRVHINASAEQRASIHAFEDLIERHLGELRGYTVDLEFVESSGPDVVEVSSDPTGWTDAGNWVGEPNGLAHELMHILGLDDEYDYIEGHATNRDMPMPTRLYWFAVEMRRTLPPDGAAGIMSNHNNPPLDRHACAVARVPNIARCVATRQALAPPRPTGIRLRQ